MVFYIATPLPTMIALRAASSRSSGPLYVWNCSGNPLLLHSSLTWGQERGHGCTLGTMPIGTGAEGRCWLSRGLRWLSCISPREFAHLGPEIGTAKCLDFGRKIHLLYLQYLFQLVGIVAFLARLNRHQGRLSHDLRNLARNRCFRYCRYVFGLRIKHLVAYITSRRYHTPARDIAALLSDFTLDLGNCL